MKKGGKVLVDTNKIRGLIAERRLTQQEVSQKMGIAPKTFYEKMKKGVFSTDEADDLIHILKIDNPAEIFFADEITLKNTKEAQ